MKTVWTDDLEPDQVIEMRGDFISSSLVRKRLKKIINDKIETKRATIRKDTNYDLSNWDCFIADSIGYERALVEIISLLDVDGK